MFPVDTADCARLVSELTVRERTIQQNQGLGMVGLGGGRLDCHDGNDFTQEIHRVDAQSTIYVEPVTIKFRCLQDLHLTSSFPCVGQRSETPHQDMYESNTDTWRLLGHLIPR